MATTPYPPGVSDHIERPLRRASADVPDYAWLLDDHPLRSYPTECCPGVLDFIRGGYCAARKNWSERVFRVVCFLLIFV